MPDIFFSKNKNNTDGEASAQDTADISEAVEYCREQYYGNQQDIYSDGIPMSKPYKPPYSQNGYQEEIPTYQLPSDEPVYYQQPQQQYYQQPEDEPPEKKKRKKGGALRFIVTVISIIAIIVGGVACCVFLVASTVDYNKIDLEKNSYISSSQLNSSKSVYNILFLGVDGTDDSSSLRSDSMMLVSIDAASKKIKLTSFLRDSWVEIPSKGKKAKLNAAFSYGGAQLAVDTIEYNFHIDIDHYVMVNFDMFTQIIDSLGGVEVEVTEKEARFIRNTTRHKNMESGENVLLNGAEALVYCRIRKLDSDYMRTFRQRKVISALIDRAKGSELTELYETAISVFPLIQTDMNAGELTQLFFKAGFALIAYNDIQQTQAPIEEHFEAGYTSGGQWAEFIDLEAVREYLYKFIYTDEISAEENAE